MRTRSAYTLQIRASLPAANGIRPAAPKNISTDEAAEIRERRNHRDSSRRARPFKKRGRQRPDDRCGGRCARVDEREKHNGRERRLRRECRDDQPATRDQAWHRHMPAARARSELRSHHSMLITAAAFGSTIQNPILSGPLSPVSRRIDGSQKLVAYTPIMIQASMRPRIHNRRSTNTCLSDEILLACGWLSTLSSRIRFSSIVSHDARSMLFGSGLPTRLEIGIAVMNNATILARRS